MSFFLKQLFVVLLFTTLPIAHAAKIKVDCRDRSPEIIVTQSGCIGPVVDIIALALTRQGHKIQWVKNTWGNSLEAAKQGDLDMLLRHSMNEEREAFLSAVVYGYESRIVYYYVRTDLGKTVNTIDDLNGFRIGMKKGSFYSQDFADNNNVIKVPFPEAVDVAYALDKGEIDIAVTSEAHGLDRIRIVPNSVRAPYTEIFTNGRYISISKNSKAIRYFDGFKEEIEQMVRSNEIDQIFRRYGMDPPDQL